MSLIRASPLSYSSPDSWGLPALRKFAATGSTLGLVSRRECLGETDFFLLWQYRTFAFLFVSRPSIQSANLRPPSLVSQIVPYPLFFAPPPPVASSEMQPPSAFRFFVFHLNLSPTYLSAVSVFSDSFPPEIPAGRRTKFFFNVRRSLALFFFFGFVLQSRPERGRVAVRSLRVPSAFKLDLGFLFPVFP